MSRRHPCRGDVLLLVLAFIGVASVLLGASLALITHKARLVHMAACRAQALYLAESGLDAAVDLLNQGWAVSRQPGVFPLQEEVSVPSDDPDGAARLAGSFDVMVRELSEGRLELMSTGFSRSAEGEHASATRRLIMEVVSRVRPVFRRVGRPEVLEMESVHFDDDGIPDLLRTQGTFLSVIGPEDAQAWTAGSPLAAELGYHFVASFTDVNLDGDLDLVLSSALSRPADARQGVLPPAEGLSEDALAKTGSSATTADVFGTGRPIPVVADGWVFLPEGSLSGLEPEAEILIQQSVYAGARPVSWRELLVQAAPAGSRSGSAPRANH